MGIPEQLRELADNLKEVEAEQDKVTKKIEAAKKHLAKVEEEKKATAQRLEAA